MEVKLLTLYSNLEKNKIEQIVCCNHLLNQVYFRYEICKVNFADGQNVEYIYCIKYSDSSAVQTNFHPLEVTDTTVSCNLDQRQRSSQQILDLADYLEIHSDYLEIYYGKTPMRKYHSPKSFSSDIPLWLELVDPKSFFDYFKDKFETDDVMVIYDGTTNNLNVYEEFCRKVDNLDDIEEFCRKQNWLCTHWDNVIGIEASVTILYDLGVFWYESFTRAKTQLFIVTIDGKDRCVLYF